MTLWAPGGERFAFRKELKGSECEAEKIAKIECRVSSARFVVPSIWLQFAVVAGFLSVGHGLNARNQKARKFSQARNEGDKTPNRIMAGATENLHDRDNNEKKNEQNNRGINVEERPKVPLGSLLYGQEGQQPHVILRHAFLQERTRSNRQTRSTYVTGGAVTLLTPVKWRTRRCKAVLHNDGNGVSQDLVFSLSASHLDSLTCRSTHLRWRHCGGYRHACCRSWCRRNLV
jgi:hypothetical protein